MDGSKNAIVTGDQKNCPTIGVCGKVLDAGSQMMEIVGRFHQFCHSLQRTNTASAAAQAFTLNGGVRG
jgi:hypothetical protein